MADKNKNQPGIKVQASIGDWVRNNDGVVGQIISVKDGKPIVKVPRTGAEVSNEGWKVIVRANEVNKDDSVDVLQKELRILNSPEALMKFATPTAEGQRARKNKIALCCVDDLTDFGYKLVKDRFINAVKGKATAKVIGVDKLGQMDFVAVQLGDEKDFPFTVMLEIIRDGDGVPMRIRLLNSDLPVEFLKDFAKFLTDLAKEGSAKASLDQTVAGPKLERCVSKVKKQLTDKAKKTVSDKKKKDIESSAFAICTSQGLK